MTRDIAKLFFSKFSINFEYSGCFPEELFLSFFTLNTYRMLFIFEINYVFVCKSQCRYNINHLISNLTEKFSTTYFFRFHDFRIFLKASQQLENQCLRLLWRTRVMKLRYSAFIKILVNAYPVVYTGFCVWGGGPGSMGGVLFHWRNQKFRIFSNSKIFKKC